MYFNRKVYYQVSDSTLQGTLFVKFWYSSKEDDPQLSEELLKYSFLVQLHAYMKTDFCHMCQQKTMYQNRLKVEAELRVWLPFINPDIKKSCKNVKQCIFKISKNSYFSSKCYLFM